jgi:hypothetical protein
MLIKATRVMTRPMRPEGMGSSSKSSNYQRRRKDLSSCVDDGRQSEVGGRMSRFRRLARDHERLPETLAEPHYVTFVILMLKNLVTILS